MAHLKNKLMNKKNLFAQWSQKAIKPKTKQHLGGKQTKNNEEPNPFHIDHLGKNQTDEKKKTKKFTFNTNTHVHNNI